MKLSRHLCYLLCATFLAGATHLVAADPRPNIIFILADDLGYGDLGCYGQKKIKTPNLDKMAAEGMRFTQFYAGCTVCAPSRSVLMTGQHMGHTTVRGNAGKTNPAAQTLKDADITVPEILKSVSYSTALIGKWGLGEEGSEGIPRKQGFDYFYGYLNQHHAHNYYPSFLIRNESRVLLGNVVPAATEESGIPSTDYGRGWASKQIDYSHDLMAEEALRWIDANKGKPFFLYLAFTTPHANNEGTRGTGNGQEVPDYGIYKDKDWTPQNKGQAAMVSRMDADIGRLFARLKEHGIDRNTLVMFSSDNGNHKEGGNDPEFFDANGPLRGMKRDLTEGGIRVPFLARWPGKIKAGSLSAHVGYFGDLMATVAELSGATLPPDRDSISFAPTLLGKEYDQKKHDFLYWEFHERGFNQAALMDERWKGIRKAKRDAPIELYDLQLDIGEEKNVAAEFPEVAAKLDQYLRTARSENPHWPIKDPPAAAPAKKKAK